MAMGAGAGEGIDALVVDVGVGTTLTGLFAAANTAPLARSTTLGAAVFPESQSAAERDGSTDGAGG